MTEEEVVKLLQGRSWAISELARLKVKQRPTIEPLILKLRGLNVQPEDILTRYSAEVKWDVPARFAESSAYRNALPNLSASLAPVKLIKSLCDECLNLVEKKGLSEAVTEKLVAVMGENARSPLVFTNAGSGKLAGKIFLIELALSLANRSGVLQVYGNNCYMRLRSKGSGVRAPTVVIGLYDVKRDVKPAQYIYDLLHGPRGYVKFPTFDSLDRCYLWATENLKADEAAEIKLLLLRLKVDESPILASRFEQKIYRLYSQNGAKGDEDAGVVQLKLYTDDALENVRSIWTEGDCPDYLTYSALYNHLIPTYMSEKEWKSVFQNEFVEESKFSFEDVDSIDRRFEDFVTYFKQKQEASI